MLKLDANVPVTVDLISFKPFKVSFVSIKLLILFASSPVAPAVRIAFCFSNSTVDEVSDSIKSILPCFKLGITLACCCNKSNSILDTSDACFLVFAISDSNANFLFNAATSASKFACVGAVAANAFAVSNSATALALAFDNSFSLSVICLSIASISGIANPPFSTPSVFA